LAPVAVASGDQCFAEAKVSGLRGKRGGDLFYRDDALVDKDFPKAAAVTSKRGAVRI
jgi:hypothetical protein